MDLTQLANLGEFIGGIAVIGSLLFVGAQVRSNAKAVRQSSTHGAIETWASMNEQFAHNHEVARLVVKTLGASQDDLDENEFAQVSALFRATCMRLEAEYFLYESGTMEKELWQKHLAVTRAMLDGPIGARWWEQESGAAQLMYTDRFVAVLRG